MPGVTCAKCRSAFIVNNAPGVAAVDEVASKLGRHDAPGLEEMPPLEPDHAPLYLCNWPNKEEEQGR